MRKAYSFCACNRQDRLRLLSKNELLHVAAGWQGTCSGIAFTMSFISGMGTIIFFMGTYVKHAAVPATTTTSVGYNFVATFSNYEGENAAIFTRGKIAQIIGVYFTLAGGFAVLAASIAGCT